MKDNFSGFQNATAPPIVCGCGHRAGPRSALLHTCPGWALNTGGEAPDPSHGWDLHCSSTCSSLTPTAERVWPLESLQSRHPFHLPGCSKQCYLLCFCSMGRKNFPKMGFFPKCNQCPWWWLFIPVCSIKACEEIPYKKHACMNKYHSEMRRSTKKKIQTNFVFPYGGFLAMTTNNKNYIWGHDILLFLFFVKVL